MRIFTLVLLSTAAAMPLSGGALAADYDPPIVMDRAPDIVPVEIGTGWYLRGDVGYAAGTEPDGAFAYRTFDGIDYGSQTLDTARLSDDFNFGVGIGYSFTDWLRADVTVDRFTAGFGGAKTVAAPCTGAQPAGTDCRLEGSSDMTGYSAMLNAYADLGTFVGFTPYVGAGLGYSYVRWDDLHGGAYCAGDACTAPALVGTGSRPGESDWRFTYALMAGVAYDVSENMKIDLGYRYKAIDGGDMFGWGPAAAAAGATGTQGSDPGLASHEIRVGLRYALW